MYLRSDFGLIIYAPFSCLADTLCATIRMNTVLLAYWQFTTGRNLICETQHVRPGNSDSLNTVSKMLQYLHTCENNVSKLSNKCARSIRCVSYKQCAARQLYMP